MPGQEASVSRLMTITNQHCSVLAIKRAADTLCSAHAEFPAGSASAVTAISCRSVVVKGIT